MAKAKNTDAPVEGRTSFEDEIDKVVPKKAKVERSFGPEVEVKITRFGAGKVSSGEHIAEHGDRMADEGEVLIVHKSVADQLEHRGLAEIQ